MALMRAREASMRTFRPMLGEHGLTEQQWRVLRALRATRVGLEVGELAEATFLLGPSLSRILANLEDRQLVARSSVPRDARRSRISLTGLKVRYAGCARACVGKTVGIADGRAGGPAAGSVRLSPTLRGHYATILCAVWGVPTGGRPS